MVALVTNTINPYHKLKCLWLINLIKQNNYVNIKGRTCRDGIPQQKCIMKQDVTSLSIFPKYMVLSLIQGAHEIQKSIVFNFPGEYLNSYMPNKG